MGVAQNGRFAMEDPNPKWMITTTFLAKLHILMGRYRRSCGKPIGHVIFFWVAYFQTNPPIYWKLTEELGVSHGYRWFIWSFDGKSGGI